MEAEKKLYIDCEFNGFSGDLISIGIATDGSEFYGVVDCHNPTPWVEEHVIKNLGQAPEDLLNLKIRLWKYLREMRAETLVIHADWPADLRFFFELLYDDNIAFSDKAIRTVLLPRTTHSRADVKHNALDDAIFLKQTVENSKPGFRLVG